MLGHSHFLGGCKPKKRGVNAWALDYLGIGIPVHPKLRSVKRVETPRTSRYSCCVVLMPLARNLFSPVRIITMDKNNVTIINEVGRDVGFLSQPLTVPPLACRERLMESSIRPRI